MKIMYRTANLIAQLRIETVTKAIIRSFLKRRAEEPSSFRFWSNRPLLRSAPILLWPLISCAVVPQEFSKPVFERVRRVQPSVAKITLDTEDPGKIMIAHGSACAQSDQPGEEGIVELAGTFTLPFYANSATVFLNGWRLRYLDGDEDLKSLSAAITDIEVTVSTLSWVAQGHLTDNDFQDGYEFCYNYTILAWNSALVDALADHSNDHVNSRDSSSPQDTTALGALSSYVQNEGFIGKKTVAIIPQGFWLGWGEDRHLLQIAYNLDHAEAFVRQGDSYSSLSPPAGSAAASRVDQAIRRWESYSILKENDRRHYYSFWEYFSALAGNDVTVTEPPFTILPKEDIGFGDGCIGAPAGPNSQEVEVRNLPFDYVVPVLSGWDLGYACDDEHVKEIGIWLENITYEKELGSPTGTLRYTVVSVLRDDDDWPGHYSRHKVTILGLNGREPADLVPYESAPSFCKKDTDGRLLLSVANTGKGDAPASTTDVQFSSLGKIKVLTPPIPPIATPPIPRGFIATLEPVDVPPLCANGCSITITVDSQSDVLEIDETNNIAKGSCIGLSDS